MKVSVAIIAAACILGAVSNVFAQCNTNAAESCLYSWESTACDTCDNVGAISGCNQRATVHLTIDDGPFDYWTTVLDMLLWKNVKATFFVVGQQIDGTVAPANALQIMNRIVAEGHAIGCHSKTHPHMNTLTVAQMDDEISSCVASVKKATGLVPTLFRPPFGECNKICMQQLNAANLTATYWNFDTNDWQDNMSILEKDVDAYPSPPAGDATVPDNIIGVCPTKAPGLIMLMHMADNMALCALPAIIDRVRYKGWNFVNGDQCYGAASLSSTPIPLSAPVPATQTPWPTPACTTAGPVPIIPMDPCLANNGGCTANQLCTSLGNYTAGNRNVSCTCRTGFTDLGNGNCTNINECATSNGGCNPGLATCTDVIPSAADWTKTHTCTCHEGYYGDGLPYCTNLNECATNNGGCAGTCVDDVPLASNNWNPYTCSCLAGTTGNGKNCTDINECATNNGGCSPLTTCTNNAPTAQNPIPYTCGPCPSGYTGDGKSGCTDVNECASAGSCDSAATCTNSPGSFQCACRQGFTGTGATGDCKNINECATNNGGCSTNPKVECKDKTPSASDNWSVGSTCGSCPAGYSGNGKVCTRNGDNNNGQSSSSTGSSNPADDPSVLSGAATASVGVVVTVAIPFAAQLFAAN